MSSTNNSNYADKAWRVDFGNSFGGCVYDSDKSNAYYVRAVRGGR